MIDQFENFISTNCLFTRKSKLLLAISGGSDSVCLFYLLKNCGYQVSLAHCNYHLRGEDSNKDQVFVEKLSQKFKVHCHIKSFDSKEDKKALKNNVQLNARKMRYQWFEQLMSEHGYDCLLTAHHLNDNLETMLINQLRGTGISGLHGIPISNNNIARPLMCFTKYQIQDYLTKNKIKFREDTSNLKSDYLRNKIRHKVYPELRKIESNIEHRFFDTAQQIAEFELLFNEVFSKHTKGVFQIKKDTIEIHYQLIQTDYKALFYYQLLKPYQFSYSQCQEVLKLEKAISGKKVMTTDYELIKHNQVFQLIKRNDVKKTGSLLIQKTGEFEINGVTYLLSKTKIKSQDELRKNTNGVMFNGENISFPITVRPWKHGDYIMPLGMKNKKKLSDILINKKIPANQKSETLVVVSNSDIVAILNPNILAEPYKINTVKDLVFKISKK